MGELAPVDWSGPARTAPPAIRAQLELLRHRLRSWPADFARLCTIAVGPRGTGAVHLVESSGRLACGETRDGLMILHTQAIDPLVAWTVCGACADVRVDVVRHARGGHALTTIADQTREVEDALALTGALADVIASRDELARVHAGEVLLLRDWVLDGADGLVEDVDGAQVLWPFAIGLAALHREGTEVLARHVGGEGVAIAASRWRDLMLEAVWQRRREERCHAVVCRAVAAATGRDVEVLARAVGDAIDAWDAKAASIAGATGTGTVVAYGPAQAYGLEVRLWARWPKRVEGEEHPWVVPLVAGLWMRCSGAYRVEGLDPYASAVLSWWEPHRDLVDVMRLARAALA